MEMSKHNYFAVANKVILITGSSGLIGRYLVDLFLTQGARVVAADLFHPSASLEGSSRPENFLECRMDITEEQSIAEGIAAAIHHFGRIDVLINSAAIDAKFEGDSQTDLAALDFSEFPFAALEKSIAVNVSGTIRVTQLAIKAMLSQQPGGGVVINIASTYSLVGANPALYETGDGVFRNKPMDYVASKSYIPNFTRHLAVHYGKKGIRVNAIAPHGIFNNHQPPFTENFEKLSPMGRMCAVEELAGPFLFLASEASSYMTGHTLVVDGGWTAF
jgi:NAD(P)-dependent dehydrogenase (short-subunit alcohol dehydrogenase family)